MDLGKLKRVGKILLYIKLHIIACAFIIFAFIPIATWYMNYRPIWGVDFFLSVSLAKILNMNFVAPFAFWNYGMFGGFPGALYPFLNIYIIAIFNNFYDLVISAQLYMMVSAIVFALGAYFLFFILSRSFILSAVLAIATVYSVGVYETLTWAGSLPSFSTQAAFPWALLFFIRFLKSQKLRHLLTSALIAGVSIFGHPLVYVVYIVPAILILTVTDFSRGFKLLEKFKVLLLFFALSLGIGFSQFHISGDSFKQVVSPSYKIALSTTRPPTPEEAKIKKGIEGFNRAQVERIILDNHILPFILVVITGIFFAASVILGKKKESLAGFLPYLILAAYFTFYIWLFGEGISIYHGGWYRLFWSVPIWVGALCSAFWGLTRANISHFIGHKFLKLLLIFVLDLVILFVAVGYLTQFPVEKTIQQIIVRSQASSGNTDAVNLKVTDAERETLKQKLTPSWLNADDTNYRLYDADQTVNIFWNSYFKMPLARGYLDPPSERGYLFWFDAALSETDNQPQLVKSFGYPMDTAISNTLFLLDWNSVKYYEGGHVGDVYTPLPGYLSEYVKRSEVMDLNAEKYTKHGVTLNFSEFEDELVSPILSGTNSSTIGIFGSERGYETVVRAIAERGNFNSQVLIPIKLGQKIDVYSLSELKNFDALYLYDYDYDKADNAFRNLTEYVSGGRKVFIETGVEVKQSQGVLPDFFPVEGVERRGLGKDWSLENPDKLFGDNVDFTKFSPPVFDNDEWKFSYSDFDIRTNAQVILKNKGKIVAAMQKIGNGEVIWSGLNLAYHLTRNHNFDETVFFDNILSYMVDLNVKSPPPSATNFINPNQRTITTEGAKGILFKEQAYDGWYAKLTDNQRGLKIYKAGPAIPGYMYIPLPDQKSHEVILSFRGSLWDKAAISIAIILVVLILEEVLLYGLTLGRLRRWIWIKSKHKIRSWWEKEEV